LLPEVSVVQVELVILFLDIIVVVLVEVTITATKLLPAPTTIYTNPISIKPPNNIKTPTLTSSKNLTIPTLTLISQKFSLDNQDSFADNDASLMDFKQLLVHLVEKKTSAFEHHFSGGLGWVGGFGRGGEGGFCHCDGAGEGVRGLCCNVVEGRR
jgi:hypothetical protein